MKPLRRLLLAALLAAPALARADEDEYGPKRDATRHFFVPTFGDYRADLEDARKEGKLGLVAMFHWEDCPYCVRMKRDVLSREAVQQWYRARYLPIAVDTRGSIQVVDFEGRRMSERRFADEAGVKVTPTFIFYDLDGRPLYRHRGEIRDPGTFIRLGKFVAEGHYKTQSFDAYLKATIGNS